MARLDMWRRDGSVGKVVLAFEVLGVEPGCSDADLKAAYKALARNCHPDKNPGDAGAHGRFIEVQAAYETLTDPENYWTIHSFRNFPEQFKDLVRKCEHNRQIREQTARALEKAKEEAATRVQAAKEQANKHVQASKDRLQKAQEDLQKVKDALARQEQAEQHEREQREVLSCVEVIWIAQP
jgi:curved DNA-binding protein CbpA